MAIFSAAALFVLFLRQTGALLDPQICCEDGKFYSEAYNLGWLHAVLLPNAGYLDIEPRLVAAVALLVPLHVAPLLENLFGLTAQILPSLYLLSSRAVTWGPLQIRALMAGMYILMTNSSAVHVFSLNSPWHLAVLAPLIAFAAVPDEWSLVLVDCGLLLLAGLSGPYCLLLLPVLMYYAWAQGGNVVWLRTALVACCAGLQLLTLAKGTRTTETVLGASVTTLARILAGNVALATIFGGRIPFASRLPMVFIVLALLVGAFVLYIGNKAAPRAVRLFTLYAFLLLGASLYRSLPTYPVPAWIFWMRAHGERYYYIPVVACTFSLLWAVFGKAASRRGRLIATCALCLWPLGAGLDFVHPRLHEPEFSSNAAVFESAPRGQRVQVPIYPGHGWHMLLRKH